MGRHRRRPGRNVVGEAALYLAIGLLALAVLCAIVTVVGGGTLR